MLTRRAFAACAFCAAGGFFASGVGAESAQTPGLKRTLIKQTDGPVEGYVTVEMRVEIEPGAAVARHTHPGIESSYLVEGGLELLVDGENDRALAPGDGFQIPPGRPHSGTNGAAKSVLVGTYVVEKGKPLASPA